MQFRTKEEILLVLKDKNFRKVTKSILGSSATHNEIVSFNQKIRNICVRDAIITHDVYILLCRYCFPND